MFLKYSRIIFQIDISQFVLQVTAIKKRNLNKGIVAECYNLV